MGVVRAIVAAVLVLGVAVGQARAQVSPFEAVDWSEAPRVRVQVNGEWWELVSIHGVGFERIYNHALETYGSQERAQKRIDEDLLEVLGGLGTAPPRETVALELRPEGGGDVIRMDAAPMTRANRQLLWTARQVGESNRRIAATGNAPESFDRATVHAMLDELGVLLETRHAYSVAGGVDVAGAIARAKDALPADRAGGAAVVREVQRVLALSGDGHARVGGMIGMAAEGLDGGPDLPFVVVALEPRAGGRIIAVEDRGGRLLDPSHPYLVAIDGVEIERWLEVAAEIAPGGSEQSERYGACRAMRSPGWIRDRLGLASGPAAIVTLESGEGTRRELRAGTVPTQPREFRKGAVGQSARLSAGIAYIPIARMFNPDDRADPRARDEYQKIERALRGAESASGIVIDIRGNRGGSRDILHLVASALMAPDHPPVVYSAARALMWPGRDPGEVERKLAGRYLHPVDSDRWSDAERGAIGAFLARFRPEAALPDDRFGPLHVSVLSPGGEGAGTLAGSLAGKPVVVLMDETCISAADVFLAALGELPQVTLMGRPSRGASGMTEDHLIRGPVEIGLASMVSFMPDGRVFDWHGVTPDIAAELTPEDFTRAGRDTALEAALERLR
ncbi:MAG: hypothetical protein IT431_00095 [Phycisphaerales bacterium]|nr:hypothetical protein [Phycisphaerales bacterium]